MTNDSRTIICTSATRFSNILEPAGDAHDHEQARQDEDEQRPESCAQANESVVHLCVTSHMVVHRSRINTWRRKYRTETYGAE
ncbi:hypothetical protein HCTV5_102 [Halovirus HCTV-5]|uniref:hypothetical protein n=1 Tax=Halovirus HCTV-5 TaxID=1273748 RepID=UPI000334859C|nr:hypothetical protein M200_gp059 [Halovirus HCTV-5]AGM11775.1 hypothetical protein HCTV5_102 [Halovirus HCTV-5]